MPHGPLPFWSSEMSTAEDVEKLEEQYNYDGTEGNDADYVAPDLPTPFDEDESADDSGAEPETKELPASDDSESDADDTVADEQSGDDEGESGEDQNAEIIARAQTWGVTEAEAKRRAEDGSLDAFLDGIANHFATAGQESLQSQDDFVDGSPAALTKEQPKKPEESAAPSGPVDIDKFTEELVGNLEASGIDPETGQAVAKAFKDLDSAWRGELGSVRDTVQGLQQVEMQREQAAELDKFDAFLTKLDPELYGDGDRYSLKDDSKIEERSKVLNYYDAMLAGFQSRGVEESRIPKAEELFLAAHRAVNGEKIAKSERARIRKTLSKAKPGTAPTHREGGGPQDPDQRATSSVGRFLAERGWGHSQ